MDTRTQYDRRKEAQQNWDVSCWLRTRGLSRKKIESHPHFDDIVTLLMFDHWQTHMTSKDLAIWTHCWSWSYSKQLPLSQYHKRKLQSIVDHIELRQLRLKHIQARQTNRASEIGKRSHNKDDKGLRLPDSVTTDLG
jgi:hypothetical protein